VTLVASTRRGPYEIPSPLGAGGMGEVYQARDSELKHEVAIKVLPQSLVADEVPEARRQREAIGVRSPKEGESPASISNVGPALRWAGGRRGRGDLRTHEALGQERPELLVGDRFRNVGVEPGVQSLLEILGPDVAG
jgi:hypothetical protein